MLLPSLGATQGPRTVLPTLPVPPPLLGFLVRGVLLLVPMLLLPSQFVRRRHSSRLSAICSRCVSPSRRGSSRIATASRQSSVPTRHTRPSSPALQLSQALRIRTVSSR